MSKLCEHILTIKLQKVANLINKCPDKCTDNKKHESKSQLSLCLSCGHARCNGQQQFTCSYQHYYGTKHHIVFRLYNKDIYCFSCEKSITNNINSLQEDEKTKNKTQKIIDMHNRIVQLSLKLNQRKPHIQIIQQPKNINKKSIKTKQDNNQSDKQYFQYKKPIEHQNTLVHTQKQVKLCVFGLKNLGNTCFFNSVIQCLYATELLHSSYATLNFDSNTNFDRVGQINIIFSKYLKNNQKNFSPKALFNWVCRSKGVYKNMDQQDAQQVMGVILNGLIDGQKFWMGKQKIKHLDKNVKNTITEQIFGFFISSRLECLGCDKVSWSVDFSLEIPVQLNKVSKKVMDLPQGQISKEQIGEQGLVYPPHEQSNSFVDHFFFPQLFNKQNYFVCQTCGSQKAYRKFYIKSPPNVLIVSLKRFNNNGSKNNAGIRVPFQLDMTGHILNPGKHQYQIFAMTVHSGTAHGGHYTAYTRREKDWYYFSDSNYKVQPWERVKTCQPYILFYKRI